MVNLSELWGDLLSEEPKRILRARAQLTEAEATAVLEHLHRMRDEDGWHPEQRASAAVALRVLQGPAEAPGAA